MKSLKDIHKRYKLTTIHVTHNFREASFLADTIAVIKEGKVLQVGKSEEVLNAPKSLDIANFLGFKNIFPTSLLDENAQKKHFSIDPNLIRVLDAKNCDYVFEGVIDDMMRLVDHYKIFATVLDHQFFIKLPKREYGKSSLENSTKIQLGFDRKDVYFI